MVCFTHSNRISIRYDAGIQTFDTANVGFSESYNWLCNFIFTPQAYSNGLSEVILGKAIKEHNLPRDEIVVMTKVCTTLTK